jgi:pimeloyl-ACP methyl ester carboxylesterase
VGRRGRVSSFRSDAARERFLEAYRRAMDRLLVPDATFDVPTTFGTVRAYRFDGPAGVSSPVAPLLPAGRTRPVVLLPGRTASTPMWDANVAGLLAHRTVFGVDLIGEPGLSVQRRPLTGGEDQAQWLDELLTGLGLESVHLMGVSFGGWSAVNYAVRRPGRAASLTVLDPVMTFAPVPVRTMLALIPVSVPSTPDALRRRVLRWLAGGADVDDSAPVAAMIAAATAGFTVRQPAPIRFTDDRLRSIDVPVLAVIAGRSVIHDGKRAAAHARKTLRHGQVELWPAASHAINGEYPDEIATVAATLWDEVDR